MKRLIILVIFILMILLQKNTFAQSDISGVGTGHNPGNSNTGYYSGWDANCTFPFNLEQNNTSSPQNIQFWTNGTQKMTLLGSSGTSDGFLGIATSSPTYVLDIDGNATTTPTGNVFRTNGKSAATTSWRMLRGGTEYGVLSNNQDANFYLYAAGSSGDMVFQTNNSGSPLGRMIIKSGGNVGVGTPSPSATLHVGGNVKVNTVTANTGNFNYLVYNSSTHEIESSDIFGSKHP